MNKLVFLAGAGLLAVAATSLSYDSPAAAQSNRDIVVTGATIASGVARVPTEWFAKRPFMQQPRLSPDGSKVIVRMSNQGRDYLALIDLTRPGSRPDFFMAANEYRDAGDRTMGAYRFVGNNTVVVTVASREILGGQRVDLTRLVAYDLGTKRFTQLAWDGAGGGASNILDINHAGEKILLERSGFENGSFTGNEVVEVDVKTGRYTMVQRPNSQIGGWFADANGVVRGGTSYDPDNGRNRIMYRSNTSQNFRTISNQSDPSFTDAGVRPQFVDPTSDMGIAADNKSGFTKLYRINMSTLEYGDVLFEANGYDVDGIRTNFNGDKVIGYTVTEARARTHWIDPVYREIQGLLDEMFGAGNAVIGSSNAAENKFVVYVAKANQRGSYYVYDTVSGNIGLLGHISAQITDVELNDVSAFRYRASDGLEIEAVMTMPRHREQTRGLPLVIITHGGPFGPRDEVAFDSWAQTIAEAGYVVVQPNYRGSGGYGANFTKLGRDDGFGFRMQDDLDDVITHLAAQGTIDPNRVCMMGWSYGGYASARAAQRNPEKYRCTVAGAGVYDLAMMRAFDATYLGRFGKNYLSKGDADLASVSPARNTAGRWAPIMVVHGVRDRRVPIEQGRTLVSRLRGSGKAEGRDYEYIEQPQNTHNLDYEDVTLEWLAGAERWIQRWNPAYIESDTDRPVPVFGQGGGRTAARQQ